MVAELGPDWRERFDEFDFKPAAAASLGQVHKGGRSTANRSPASCNIRRWPRRWRPTFAARSSVLAAQADRRRRSRRARSPARSASGCAKNSTTCARRRSRASIGVMLADRPFVRVPRVHDELSTGRLLTLQWLEGEKLVEFEKRAAGGARRDRGRPVRRLVAAVPSLRRHPRRSASGQLRRRRLGRGGGPRRSRRSICSTTAACGSSRRASSAAWSNSIAALLSERRGASARGLRDVGLPDLTRGTFDAMTLWARFICGPILDDRVRTAADGVEPGRIRAQGDRSGDAGAEGRGRRAARAARVRLPRTRDHRPRRRVPRLGARLNFHRLYEDAIADFDADAVGKRQAEGLEAVGLEK